MLLISPADLLLHLGDTLQIVLDLAVLVLAAALLWQMRGIGRTGNRVQIDVDLQVLDLSGGELIGELIVVLQNMGQRHQPLRNLFIEVRPSRYASKNNAPLVPPMNMISPELHEITLAPGVRQLLTWTFEVPRDEKLLRVTALINTGRRQEGEAVPTLTQQHFRQFGETMRYTSRIFEVAPGLFRRI